jgi:hypothetical protein
LPERGIDVRDAVLPVGTLSGDTTVVLPDVFGVERERVSAWRRYGHDRLYLNLPSGQKVAWFDCRSGKPHLLVEQPTPVCAPGTIRDRQR